MGAPAPPRAKLDVWTIVSKTSYEEAHLALYAQSMLTALHTILSSGGAADYVVYAACSSLAILAAQLSDAAGKPMGSAYTAFAPQLRQHARVLLGFALDGAEGLACLAWLPTACTA